jgi:glycosyltransferase involved in cell wall biosynthesis
MAFSVILFHRTIGSEYDDRIQKIFGSIVCTDSAVPTAFLWERENTARKGDFLQGGSFEVFRLPFASRKIPRPGPFWSFYEIIAESLMGFLKVRDQAPDVVVIQNHRLFGLVHLLLLSQKRKYRLVWDLRELPTGFMRKGSLRAQYFGKLMQKCDAVIVTNQSRQAYMRELYGSVSLEKSVTIPNYPSIEFASSPTTELNDQLAAKLANKPFFYIQNPSSPDRYPKQAIEAILKYTNILAVVSGRLNDQVKRDLETSWGDVFRERVLLTGMITGEEIISLLDRCVAALVFYDWDRPNNDFCDPNRLYQAIARGAPVVVGANKGMKPIVGRLCCGVVTDGDGRSVEDIGSALQRLLLDHDVYRHNAMEARTAFSWKSNERELLRAIFGDECEESVNSK